MSFGGCFTHHVPATEAQQQTNAAVTAAAAGTGFQCVPVSWEDAQRSASLFGGVTSGGPNISDVRLWAKAGTLLYTLRSRNWNERLGYVRAADVALVTGNELRQASAQTPTTLAAYLQNIGGHAGYAGVRVPSLFDPALDEIFGIRFQTVFLPVTGSEPNPFNSSGATPPAATEFTTEVYNYQTRSADDPKNLLLLATPQGVSCQQDSPGKGKLFYHSVGADGTVHRYWLEAEKSEKKVGGAQVETAEEAQAAAARGKATAVRIGPSSMGTRFNVQMLIQVPLKQKAQRTLRGTAKKAEKKTGSGMFGGSSKSCNAPAAACAPQLEDESDDDESESDEDDCLDECVAAAPQQQFKPTVRSRRSTAVGATATGTSNAARVSRGSLHDTWRGVANKTPQRDPTQHGTITVTMYYTVVGGVPSAEDVRRAVKDLDDLYKACPSDKRLARATEITAANGAGTTTKPKGLPPTTVAPVPTPTPAPHTVIPTAAMHAHVRCPGNHVAAAVCGGEYNEPPTGWVCDACGVYTAAGPLPAGGGVKGYSCRGCDFDVCAGCAARPKCVAGHVMLPAPPGTLCTPQAPYAKCVGCERQFAGSGAAMWRCACGTVFCTECRMGRPPLGIAAMPPHHVAVDSTSHTYDPMVMQAR